MKSWVTGATFGAASSLIVLTVASLLAPAGGPFGESSTAASRSEPEVVKEVAPAPEPKAPEPNAPKASVTPATEAAAPAASETPAAADQPTADASAATSDAPAAGDDAPAGSFDNVPQERVTPGSTGAVRLGEPPDLPERAKAVDAPEETHAEAPPAPAVPEPAPVIIADLGVGLAAPGLEADTPVKVPSRVSLVLTGNATILAAFSQSDLPVASDLSPYAAYVEPEPAPAAETAETEPATNPGEPAKVLPRVRNAEGASDLPGSRKSGLPQIGAEAEPVEVEPVPEGESVVVARTDYAAPYERGDLPLVSVVLVDDPANPVDLAGLAGMALTFAVTAGSEGSAERIAAYRAAGQEVLLVTPLPEGATASDVMVAFETYLSSKPEVVGIAEPAPGAFQDREVSAAVTNLASAGGYGLLASSSGLNAVRQAAGDAGVPIALVQRDLGDIASDGDAIKRALDQAAFRAGREEAVVLSAPATPEVIKALADWSDGHASRSAALAPLSAIYTDLLTF